MHNKFFFPTRRIAIFVFLLFIVGGCIDRQNGGESNCPPPTVTINPLQSEIVAGDPILLSASATGQGLTFSWFNGSDPIPNSNASSIMYKVPQALGSILIRVIVKDSCGEREEATLDLPIQTPTPTIDETATAEAAAMTRNAVATAEAAAMTRDAVATAEAAAMTRDAVATVTAENATAIVQAMTAQAIEAATTQANETATTQAAIQQTANAQAAGTRYAATATANAIPLIMNAQAEIQPGNTSVLFTWGWNGELGPNTYFAVRFGPDGGDIHSRVWTKDSEYYLNVGDNTEFPKSNIYSWHIAVIEDEYPYTGGGDDGTWRELTRTPYQSLELPPIKPTIPSPN